jgi:hypothetical protein
MFRKNVNFNGYKNSIIGLSKKEIQDWEKKWI